MTEFLRFRAYTPCNSGRLSIIFILDMENRAFEYRQYKNGVLDEQTWLDHQHIIVENHSTVRGRKWWDQVGRNFWNQEFVDMVDALLQERESVDMYNLFSTWDNDDAREDTDEA